MKFGIGLIVAALALALAPTTAAHSTSYSTSSSSPYARPGRYHAKIKKRSIGPRGHRHICRAHVTSTLRYPRR